MAIETTWPEAMISVMQTESAKKQSILKYTRSEKFKITNARYRQSGKGKATSRRVLAEWYAKHPEAKRAHNLLNKAVLHGKIARQACQVCGSEKSHAHHLDYKNPFEVEWLCQLHHKEKHPKGGT